MAQPPILLLTRPPGASRRMLEELKAEGISGFTAIESPLLGIEHTGPLPDLDGVGGVIFTSANGVRAWVCLGGPELGLCYTVGDATAAAAAGAGFDPRSARGDADALVALIAADAPKVPLVHARGTHARGRVAERLLAQGIETREAVIYDQPAQELSASARQALDESAPVIVPLFSPRSAAQFASGGPFRAPLQVAAMSAEVVAALGALYVSGMVIADRPDAAAMRRAVIGLLGDSGALVHRHGSVKG